MSSFAVRVERVEIHPHDNADALEIARVRGYRSVVRKGAFETGDLVAYIPEHAVVPAPLLEELGLTGRLAGPDANRVHAIRLRGVLSQGICLPARPGWKRGDDVTEELGITKYVPPIPTHMNGEVWAAGRERCLRYDIENIKSFPDVLVEGEDVVLTEKLHGTWCCVGRLSEALAHPEHGELVVASKGLSGRGLAFRLDEGVNDDNLYVRAARQLFAREALSSGVFDALDIAPPVYILAEIFGAGVQDLSYDRDVRRAGRMGLRVFDVHVGPPVYGRYLDDAELDAFCDAAGLERVPVLYRGPFDPTVLAHHTEGPETISGEGQHVREGVVVRPTRERREPELGRVILKSINPSYLLREGGTEYQ